MSYEDLLEKAYQKVERVDSGERFEVPRPRGYYEGTKTIVRNFGNIASVLRRDPNHLAKFLAKNLASSFEINGDLLILFRRVPPRDISDKLEKYVQQYVLCSKCKKPDTELVVDGQHYIKCLACGEKKVVPTF